MIDLSIIITGRDDGYGDGMLSPYNEITKDTFCFRMKRTIENNLKLFSNKNINVQYVVVDWSPLNEKTLNKNEYLKEIFYFENIKHVIVPGSSIEKRGWNPNNFYEYYAKNVGIRNSDGNYLILTNPDIIFTNELCIEISEAIKSKNEKNYFRPYSRKDVDNNLLLLQEGLNFPKNKVFLDEVLGGPASGDFVMSTKNNFIEKGMGYDETFSTNPNKQQANLDPNILMNFYKNGINPYMFSSSILHLDHAKPHQREGIINLSGYNNRSDWGMLEVLTYTKNTL